MTIGTAILQTQLTQRLPAAFVAQFPGGVSLAYAAIPAIRTLEEPLKDEVRDAFAKSLQVLWQICIEIATLCLFWFLHKCMTIIGKCWSPQL